MGTNNYVHVIESVEGADLIRGVFFFDDRDQESASYASLQAYGLRAQLGKWARVVVFRKRGAPDVLQVLRHMSTVGVIGQRSSPCLS